MRRVRIMLLVALSFAAFFSFRDVLPETAAAYVSHAPISINGDGAFTAANGVTWGKGTSTNPYIIEGWNITATTASGISIQNTNAYFIIRNVHVHSGGLTNKNGVYLTNANNGAIVNVATTGDLRGIFVYMSARVIVWGGKATSNTWSGIEILSSSYTTVAGFNVTANGRDGIRVSQSYLVTVTGNIISSNQGSGISLSSSNNVTVAVNDVTANNDFAIGLSASEYNLIYHNNFGDIGPLAWDDLENANNWDGGYSTGGNYWSDYTGVDGNGDGIGDLPYTIDIDKGIQDRYPLMSRYRDIVQPTWDPGAQLVASQIGAISATLTWTQAQDDQLVLGYRVFRNGILIATLPNTMQTLQITGLSPETTYTFKVEAGDEADNWSQTGPSVVVTTAAASGGGGGGGRFFLLR